MATLDVPNRYLAVAPIIITSPTPRCGTTLVQRLVSSSENAFVYGEEVGNQIKTLTAWFVGQLQFIERMGGVLDADFNSALAGNLDAWRPGLTPPAAIMTKVWVETFYQMPFLLSSHAGSIGRPLWGFKHPSYDRDTIKAMLSFMPQARVIYVFRNLFDVLSSAKARKFVNTRNQTIKFCAQWAKNMNEAAELAQDERILFVKYEDLIQRRADYVRLLEMFTKAENIKVDTFDTKLNTYKGDKAKGHSPVQYIDPAKLTKTDRATVLDEAGPVLTHLYGDLATAA